MSSYIPNTSRKNSKYVYRYMCEVILSLIATGIFYINWYEFAKINNQTGHLLGIANLGMAAGIYLILYFIFGKWLHAFTIGVERKANILAGQVLALFMVNLIEIFVSCAITGQFRFFVRFLQIYSVVFIIQAVINCVITIPMVNLYRKVFPPLTVLEIRGNHSNDLYEKVNGLKYKYKIVESISCDDNESLIKSKIGSFDAVLLNDLPAHKKNKFVKLCLMRLMRIIF